ncbi:MAG: EamA family transporter [Firmicutes bacterium HGW-Firmicutes-9]|jgi:drug/metabolite transporter (DMT)-like permease|nr:MAG: EamA family transporter [Firmicutes bacterium HGW-Firmicutes-9]
MAKTGKATFIGLFAILLWGMLALLTSFCNRIPAFEFTAITFFIAFLIGAVYFIKTGCNWSQLRQPIGVWISGVIGLFGYHALYFAAMKCAPAIEVSLIAYLWPILIVVFSSFLPQEKLRWFHVLGTVVSFLGIALLLIANGVRIDQKHAIGYLLSLLCAVIWAGYSVISRKQKAVPMVMTGAYCGITALLSGICHLLLEQTVVPLPSEWLPAIALGVGPVGVSFFAWNYGMKHGNLRLLGTLSYLAPLISGVLLVCFGKSEYSWRLLAAGVLIMFGAMISVMDKLFRRAALMK